MTLFQFFNHHSNLLISAIGHGVVVIAFFRRHARHAWPIEIKRWQPPPPLNELE